MVRCEIWDFGESVCQNRQTRFLSITLDCCIDAMASFIHLSFFLFAALRPFYLSGVDAVPSCPHCHGNLPSCTFGTTDGSCPCDVDVASNAKAISEGSGSLSLSNLVDNRYIKMF